MEFDFLRFRRRNLPPGKVGKGESFAMWSCRQGEVQLAEPEDPKTGGDTLCWRERVVLSRLEGLSKVAVEVWRGRHLGPSSPRLQPRARRRRPGPCWITRRHPGGPGKVSAVAPAPARGSPLPLPAPAPSVLLSPTLGWGMGARCTRGRQASGR